MKNIFTKKADHKRSIALAIAALTMAAVPFTSVKASTADTLTNYKWYIGVEGGVPMAWSTFTSFAHDKTRMGWTAGLFAGYQFNDLLSAELTFKYGGMTLGASECCVNQRYWLGADDQIYYSSVLGMDSWKYSDVRSKITLGQYGARLNINLLSLLHSAKGSRWSAGLSPHIYAVNTKATIQNIDTEEDLIKGESTWHLGYGGDVQAAYRFADRWKLGIYSGITFVSGKRIDNIPKHLHKSNFLWETGLRLSYSFGKGKKSAAAPAVIPAETITPAPAPEPAPTPKTDEKKVPVVVEPVAKPAVNENKTIEFPTIYFDFNKKVFDETETSKIEKIRQLLKENPDMKVIIKGWCDTRGTKAVNDRISKRRAEIVKSWLVEHGIDGDRIETAGMGSDYNEPDAAKARRADTEKR